MAEDSATHEAMRRAAIGSENLTGQRAPARALNDRIVELRRVPASQLKPHPENWRVHPQAQQNALAGVIAQVGIADAVLAYEPTPGELVLIDGHLRRETLGDTVVPVLVTDLTEAEARLVLATHDPLAAMAEQDDTLLKELLQQVTTNDEAVAELLQRLEVMAGVWNSDIDAIDQLEATNKAAPGVIKITFPEDVRNEVVQGVTQYVLEQGWLDVYVL
jgi:hypothetical protein